MRINPHLTFDGQCEAAFRLYESCLGGQVSQTMRFGDAPALDWVPADWGDKILHGTLALEDQVLTGGDVPPDRYEKPQGFWVLLSVSVAADADRIFATLSDQGAVHLPLAETFWALRFGMVVDRFGTPWMIQCGKPAP